MEFIDMQFAADCIHLHACRRITRILKNNDVFIARGCTVRCSAYCPGNGQYVSKIDALGYAARKNRRRRNRNKANVHDSLPSKSLIDIINELEPNRGY